MFLIAEAGVNHDGSIDRALDQVDCVASAGWQAIKFQTYSSKHIAAKHSPSYWDLNEEPTTNQRDLFRKHETYKVEWYLPIINRCDELGVEFMTSVFSPELVDIYDPFLKRYKISSSDLTNHILLDKIAKKNKPIILSTGASSINEVSEAINFLSENGVDKSQITLLHCVLNYPTHSENANIRRIETLATSFDNDIGYSCHVAGSAGIKACEIAFLLGAKVIEKHISLTPFRSGNDHYHALDFEGMKRLKSLIDADRLILGNGEDQLENQVAARRNARRGLYYSTELPSGHIVQLSDLTALRPTHDGISADQINQVIGRCLLNDVKFEDPVHTTDFK